MPISAWSTTASDNDDADLASGIDWREGMSAAQVNDSARAMMAVIKSDLNVFDAWTYGAIGASAAAGTLGSATGFRGYLKLGRLVFVRYSISIASAGTGTGALKLALPYDAADRFLIPGRESAVAGIMLQGMTASNSTNMDVLTYNNTSPIASGYNVFLTGVYEATS